MRQLKVYIEIKGISQLVGQIIGNNSEDAVFSYDIDYLNKENAKAISIHLPLQEKEFSVNDTAAFFEGLLPEGFTRKSVAEYLHLDENDYISIIAKLGNECLGAIKIIENEEVANSEYEKLSQNKVRELAKEGISTSVNLVTEAHLSLAGASGKVGLYYDQKENAWYLPKGDAPSTHIVKLSHVRLNHLVVNEQLCLLTAKKLGIKTSDSFIVNTKNHNDGDILFATKRYDREISNSSRTINNLKVPFRLHQEDFAQALGVNSKNKYEKGQENYIARMFNIVRNYTMNPIVEQAKLWDMIMFDYLVGNTDNHIKNFSLVYDNELRGISLSPAYDIVSTKIYHNGSNELSLRIGDARYLEDVNKADIEKAAKEAGLGAKLALERYEYLKEQFLPALNESAEELVSIGYVVANDIVKSMTGNGSVSHC